MREWVFDLDFSKPPLSLNDRLHHHAQAKIVKMLRELACLKARKIPALIRCEVTLTWFVKDRIRRDDENPVPTLKAMCDGLVDAGVVPDDTAVFMKKLMPVIVYRPGEPASMRLTVKDLSGDW